MRFSTLAVIGSLRCALIVQDKMNQTPKIMRAYNHLELRAYGTKMHAHLFPVRVYGKRRLFRYVGLLGPVSPAGIT